MHLGIDAVNIREGGGVTHLTQLLRVGDPLAAGIERVTVWTRQVTAAQLPAQPWLTVCSEPWMEAASPLPQLRNQWAMPRLAQAGRCDLLFAPGGSLPAACNMPTVTMSRNMLPFEPEEAARFGRLSLMRLKMWLLRGSQSRSFQRGNGVIFLTRYARDTVMKAVGGRIASSALIPHGVEARFATHARTHRALADCSVANPFKLLYVSIVWSYKHQLETAQAVAALRAQGLPVQIEFVGLTRGDYGQRFLALLAKLDPRHEFLLWRGEIPYEQLHRCYAEADAFVFASSCENMPNILVEAMAAGLPIACAKRGPMPEVLGDAGVYFDPDSVESIATTLRELINDSDARARYAEAAAEAAKVYSWEKCANETFRFIREVYDANR